MPRLYCNYLSQLVAGCSPHAALEPMPPPHGLNAQTGHRTINGCQPGIYQRYIPAAIAKTDQLAPANIREAEIHIEGLGNIAGPCSGPSQDWPICAAPDSGY